MGRRIATRAIIALALLFMAMLLLAPVALADNCSSIYDCLPTADAQTSVTVAVAVLVAVAIFALPQLLNPPANKGEDTPTGSEPPPPSEAERQALLRGEMGNAPAYPHDPTMPPAYPPHAQPGYDPAHAYQEGQLQGPPGAYGPGGAQGAYPQGQESFPHQGVQSAHGEAPGAYSPGEARPYTPHQGPADAQGSLAPEPQHGQIMHAEGQGPGAEHLVNRAQAGAGAEHAANRGEAGAEHLANRNPHGTQENAPSQGSSANENRSDRPPSEIENRSNEPVAGQPAPSPSQPGGEPQVRRTEAELQMSRPDAAPQIARPDVSPSATPFVPPPELAPQATALLGLHHVTIVASDPRRNFICYAGLLGLRLVKVTVDYDRPNAYQLYYGDALGNPGSVLCFTCMPNAPRGSRGAGQAISLAFSIPADALGFWSEHLTRNGITIGGPSTRFGEQVISFFDPDGVQIDLVADVSAGERRANWHSERIPTQAALRGLHSVSLSVSEYENNAAMLQRMLGFNKIDQAGSRHRFSVGAGGPGAQLDLIHLPSVPEGTNGSGIIQHVGWRIPDETQQLIWRYALSNNQVNVSQVMDRLYYRSLYFQIPGGTLFDIATDTPGFTVDELPEQLGTHLMLPPWLEPQRAQLLAALPPLDLPVVGRG